MHPQLVPSPNTQSAALIGAEWAAEMVKRAAWGGDGAAGALLHGAAAVVTARHRRSFRTVRDPAARCCVGGHVSFREEYTMTTGWPSRPAPDPRLLAACLAFGLFAASPVLAQGGGGGAGSGSASGATSGMGTAGQGSAGQSGQASQGRQATPGPGPQTGQAAEGQPSRERVQQRERAAGVAAEPERREEQLRDLNDIARQVAPSVPAPAPGVEGNGARR